MAALDKKFQLILMMIDGSSHTALELCEKLDVSRRQLYNYIHSFQEQGFIIIEENHKYSIDVRSPFFQKLTSLVNFNDAEATFLHNLVSANDMKNPLAQAAKRKLEVFYHLRYFTDANFRAQSVENYTRLRDAIEKKLVVCLQGYSSANSRSVTDRVVEPFLIFNGDQDIRCYELKSGINKTFKLARISNVEVYDTPWIHEDAHKEMFTDIFQFSSEERFHVKLRMGFLSHNLMLEEVANSGQYFEQEDEQHWILETDVASYKGIGRFILGLYDDIEVIENDGLKAFLDDKINRMVRK